MKQRVITGLVLAVIIIPSVIFMYKPLVFPVLLATLSAFAVYEILTAVGCKNKVMVYGTAILSAVVPFLTEYRVAVPFTVVAVIVSILYLTCMVVLHEKTTFADTVTALFCLAAVPGAFSCLIRLRDMHISHPDFYDIRHSVFFVMFTFLAAWGTDIFAQLTGRKLGKHKLCPKISPKKSVEGAVGGVIGAIVLTMILFLVFDRFFFTNNSLKWYHVIIVTLFLSVVSMFGDLSASIIKRNHGVKDFGKILPGHGGIMDRFDSMLFVIPAEWAMVELIAMIEG